MDDFDIRAVIAEALLDIAEPDPHALVDVILSKVPDDALRDVVRQLLPSIIREEIRRARNSVGSTQSPSSGRWRRAGRASHDPRSWRVCVGRKWGYLGDWTATELRHAADEYRGRAVANEVMAKRLYCLADALDDAGVDYVRDLSDDVLRAVLA